MFPSCHQHIMATSLEEAIQLNDLRGFHQLISDGSADIDDRNKNGETALYKACEDGDLLVAKLLIYHGADVDIADDWKMSPLHRAAVLGYTEIAKLLIDNAANVDSRAKDRGTPLHEACFFGHLDVVTLLVAGGANIWAKDSAGEYAINYASEKGYDEICEFLRAYNK